MIKPNNTTESFLTKTPSIPNRWRFAGLSAAELLPQLQRHLTNQDATANWQLVWLNNDGKPVIGLLPKVSWSVYFAANLDNSPLPQTFKDKLANYQVVKICRVTGSSTTKYMSYIDWQNELIAYSNAYDKADNTTEKSADSLDKQDKKPKYQHGLIGFIGYDIAANELTPNANIPLAEQPSAVLGHYDIYLSPVADNNQTSWQLTTRLSDVANTNTDKNIISKLKKYLQHLDDALNSEQAKSTDKNNTQPAPLILKAKWQRSDYQQAFAQTQNYLQQGDCYQINLTQVWQGSLYKFNDTDNYKDNVAPKLLDYLPNLHANTNAPFAGYLAVAGSANNTSRSADFELLSCSPELFFTFTTDKKTNTRHIITKPIKGTIPRGVDAEQDLALKEQLIASDKDRSENVMIVDLLRNDLGKYAKTGSVKVPQLFAIESFSNVHHMVSTITAELKEDTHPLAVLFGSLPAGSITGTPKKRAVEIIDELEVAARGAYCGTMGYMNFDGSGQWNVLIRTLQAGLDSAGKKQVCLWAGGGITVASSCASEYQECLDKVGNLLGVLARGSAI